MIRFSCPICGKVYKASDDIAGRKTSCKKCGAIVVIPGQPIRVIQYGVALPDNGVVTAEPDSADSESDKWDDALNRRSNPRRSGRRCRRSGLVNAVAILYLVTGLLNFACASLILVGGAALGRMAGGEAGDIVFFASTASATIVVLLAIPDILAAHGIWRRRYWGYVLGLVLAGINGLWAFGSILLGDACSVSICGGCSIFAFAVLCNSKYANEFE